MRPVPFTFYLILRCVKQDRHCWCMLTMRGKASSVLVLLVWFSLQARGSPVVPRLEAGCYSQEGDLYLASMIRVTAKGTTGGPMCSQKLHSLYRLQYVEAFVYAVEEVNKRQDILPNITLGFVVVDTCGLDLAALAQATHFLPYDTPGPRRALTTNCSNGPPEVPITGVVGPATSREAVLVASLLSAFQIPLIATTATSDELSDKSRFEYFLRLVPPDKFQVEAILDLVSYFNWTYVSLLYSEGSYGENAAKAIMRGAKVLGVCLPVADMLASDTTASGMTYHVERLVKNIEARVVILFMQRDKLDVLFERINAMNLEGQFIWISGDSMVNTDFGRPANGAFVMHHVLPKVPRFVEQYLKLTPANKAENPWIRRQWEMLYGCTWNNETADTSCSTYIDTPKRDQPLASYLSFYIDGVYAYAHALHNMISDRCPSAFEDHTLLKLCLNGPSILSYVRSLSFQGTGGNVIRFDSNGDMLGRFSIRQYRYNDMDIVPEVAFWDHERATFDVFEEQIRWDSFRPMSLDVPVTDQKIIGLPQSICSRPCRDKEYVIQRELPCCWDCGSCRSNERVNANKTGCELCEVLTWPDDGTASECLPIPPVFLRFSDTASLAITALTVLGVLACLATTGWYLGHWKNKLIKASSRELTSMLLIGALLAYVTIFAFLVQPTDMTCALSRYGFSLSVSLIYAPLLVKTNRIYRIFSSGKRGTKKPTLIGNRAQLVISFILIILQVCIFAIAHKCVV